MSCSRRPLIHVGGSLSLSTGEHIPPTHLCCCPCSLGCGTPTMDNSRRNNNKSRRKTFLNRQSRLLDGLEKSFWLRSTTHCQQSNDQMECLPSRRDGPVRNYTEDDQNNWQENKFEKRKFNEITSKRLSVVNIIVSWKRKTNDQIGWTDFREFWLKAQHSQCPQQRQPFVGFLPLRGGWSKKAQSFFR